MNNPDRIALLLLAIAVGVLVINIQMTNARITKMHTLFTEQIIAGTQRDLTLLNMISEK